MLFLIFIVYLKCSVTSSQILYVGRDETELSNELSFCGTNYATKLLIKTVLLRSRTAEALSHCCAQHDDCYNNHQDQQNCDRIFEYCVQVQDGTILAMAYYSAVNLAGAGPYSRSYSGSGPDYSFTNSNLHDKFVDVRNECYYNRNALSSCVIQYELCNNRQQSDCKMRLAANLWRLPAAHNSPCFDVIREYIKEGLQILDIWEQNDHVGTP